MNLESDKRLNIQLRLDFSSAPTGEARQAGREDIESLSAVHEPERPANTCSKRVSATSRTAVYGAVRTVVWEGRSCEAPPYPDLSAAGMISGSWRKNSAREQSLLSGEQISAGLREAYKGTALVPALGDRQIEACLVLGQRTLQLKQEQIG